METTAGKDHPVGGTIVTPGRRRRRVPPALAWVAVGPFATWAVARLAGLERGSAAIQIMTATPYAALGSLLPLLLALLSRNRFAAGVALVTSAALGLSVLPRAVGTPDADGGGRPLRVLSINLLHGRADPAAVLHLVRRLGPDVVSAQELTPAAVAALDAAGLAGLMPHRHLQDAWSAAGSGIFARHPLTPLPGLFQPVGHNMPAAALALPGGAPVEIVDVHPFTPLGPQVPDWTAGLDRLPPASEQTVRVLAGDFNASLDHAMLREVLGRGYADAADRAGAGLIPTWPANRRVPPLITIDHVLVDERVRVRSFSVHTVPGTDHRAVFADLRLPAG